MADEIINTLGFSVDAALTALHNLDTALQASGTAFANFGAALDNFNSQAATALDTMRGLASAASKLAAASQNMSAPQAPAATNSAVQSSAQEAAASMAAVGTAAQQAGEKATTGMNQAAAATSGARTEGDRLIVSWNTIARVVMTQAIVRTLSMIRDALKEAVNSAEQFQIRLAEIQTIAPRIGGDLSKGILGMATPMKSLESEVTEFSKNFNIPLPQTEEGMYQTLSQQFTTVADRSNVMTAAMKLAKVGVMDFQDAILLVGGTLNAYGMSSEQADSVAVKFFETIRLGRVRGSELAQTMGQVVPIAGELGVSLDEVNAAMVAMTIGGMNAAKSSTALRGVMTAFIKPSTDMQKAMRGMGFSDPSQLIAAKGFEGALQAIADRSDGMSEEIAKAVRNVRALTAELRLTSDVGAKKYTEALDAMKGASSDNLDQLVKEFRSTDTDKLQTQVNALKVNLTQDFGQMMVKVLAQMMEFMGGADKMSAALVAIAAAAIPCAAAMTALAAGLMLVHLALGPIGIALMAVTAILAATVGAYTYQTLTNVANINKESETRHAAAMQVLQDEEKKIAKWKESQQAEVKKNDQSWDNQAASLRADYFKALDDLKTKNQDTVNSSKQVMESMIGAQERVVSAYRSSAEAATKAVQESQNRVLQLTATYSDTRFKYAQKDLDAETQADNYRMEALKEAQKAAQDLQKAQSPAQITNALGEFQRANTKAQEASSKADTTKNTMLQGDAEQTVLYIMQKQIEAEKQLQSLQAQQSMKLAQQAAQEQARVNNMKTLMADILKDLQAFDKQGEKDPKALSAQQTRLQQNVAQFQKQATAGQKVSVTDLLSFDALQRRVATAIEGGVSSVQIKQFNAIPQSFANLRAQIEQGVGPIHVAIKAATAGDADLLKQIKDMSADQALSHIETAAKSAEQQKINYGETVQKLGEAKTALQSFANVVKGDLDKWVNSLNQFDLDPMRGLTAFSDVQKQMRTVYEIGPKLQTQFTQLARKFADPNSQVTDADYAALQKAHDEYVKAIKPSAESEAAMQNILKHALEVKQEADAAIKTQAALKEMPQPADSDQRIQEMNDALRSSKDAADGVQKGTTGAAQGAQATTTALQQVSQTDMSGLTNQIDSAASAMWNLVSAAQAFVPPDASGAQTASHGGWMRHFAGGGAVGVDTVPAMLSPGEFVMNASSSRRFASQLVAMNAGVRPTYSGGGGSVTNIGDINVTVNGGKGSRQDARAIATELRREIRRGTSTL